jgi:hypothetical protein
LNIDKNFPEGEKFREKSDKKQVGFFPEFV